MKTNEPLRGEKLLKTAINQILANPNTWDQTQWHSACGTKHCIAGWCQILSGKPADPSKASHDAMEALDLSASDAAWFFRSSCSIGELYSLAKNFNRAGFNRAGFNRDGFNRAGFNRDGFNRAGFNRDGLDRDGKKLTLFVL